MEPARIDVVRLRTRDPDAGRALERVVRAADFRCSRLPPSAILVMRAVRCQVRASLLDAARDFRAVDAIGRAARVAIERAASRAVRLIRGSPGESADAVYFEDLAELIACLARDWLAGELGAKWWWRSVLRGRSAQAVILEYCGRRPEIVPAALAALAATGDARRFVSEIPPEEARLLASAIARTFALKHDIDALIDGPRRVAPAAPAAARDVHRLRSALPECVQPLEVRPAAALLALGLGLRRAPAQVRGDGFVAFVESLFESHDRPRAPGKGACAGTAQLPPRAAPPAFDAGRHRIHTIDSGGRAPPIVPAAFASPSSPTAPGIEMPGAHSGARAAIQDSLPLGVVRQEPALQPVAPATTPSAAGGTIARQTQAAAAAERMGGIECSTRFGGLFYVLNAALHLGLYGDFTQPRARGVELSPWDFLALCGRRWFGRRFETDPLARYLAQLAGREGEGPVAPRWMKRLVPRMEARIAQALGEPRPRRAIARLALARARAVDTGTRVDVHLELAKLPLAVRYAGLDRDPGWIPAAGRIVAFHFD